jgi:aminoglycoside 3-N-acetyltransferase
MSNKKHNFQSLTEDFKNLGIKPDDNVLIHSSMKSIGEVEGGADTVLDVFIKYLAENGNIVLPTHTWAQINAEYNIFDPEKEPSCVGILPEIFRKRKGALRSLHPTHSVAIMGKDAEYFVKGEHLIETPCGRNGCWGKFLDMDFKIIFLGCSTECNTYLHGVEEWLDVPERLTDDYQKLRIIMPDGTIFERPSRRHYNRHGNISDSYSKIQPYLEERGLVVKGKFGDADCIVNKARDLYETASELFAKDIDFFGCNPDKSNKPEENK